MKQRRRSRRIRNIAVFVAAAAFIAMAALFVLDVLLHGGHRQIDAPCEIHFIDVGQGDCTLLLTEGAAVLVDAGPSAAGEDTARYIQSYTDTVDYMILTHPHEDHIGGAAKIMSRLHVKNIIMTDASNDVATFSRLLSVMEDSGVNVIEAQVGNTYEADGIRCLLLAPLADLGSFNEYSIVTRVDYGDTSVLLTGDAETGSEALMLGTHSGELLRTDLLKLGHHGSYTSTSADFLAAVNPRWAIASCGVDNPYGHPHSQTLERAAALHIPVLRTDELGTIIFCSDGKSLWQNQ